MYCIVCYFDDCNVFLNRYDCYDVYFDVVYLKFVGEVICRLLKGVLYDRIFDG